MEEAENPEQSRQNQINNFSMKNERLTNLKKDLDFVELDQRLEMIKIPMLSELACETEKNNGCNNEFNGSCPPPAPAPTEPEVVN